MTFEGIEGSGKSTLSRALAEELTRRGLPARRTFEPGDTELGQALRPLMLADTVDVRTSALLFAADRAHHVDTVVLPALRDDRLVLCDRFETSSVVYQGRWRGLGADTVRSLSRFASAGLLPDLVIYCKLDHQLAASRRAEHPDALDEAATQAGATIADGFAEEASLDPDRFVVVDASRTIAELTTEIADLIEQRWQLRSFQQRHRAPSFAEPAATKDHAADRTRRRGRLILISGPSGAGKNTVLDDLLTNPRHPRWYSVSATTRPIRPGEVDGRDYSFISDEEFDRLVAGDGLLEHAQFANGRYGTPAGPVDQKLAQGIDVIALVELSGVRQIKALRPDALVIFLIPPSMEVLEQRLRVRATESEEQINARLSAASREMVEGPVLADYVICNDDVTSAVARIERILAQ